jgi:hypothetical protein
VESKTRIIDLDLRAYFDNVQHYLLLEKVARRVTPTFICCRSVLDKTVSMTHARNVTRHPRGDFRPAFSSDLPAWVCQ